MPKRIIGAPLRDDGTSGLLWQKPRATGTVVGRELDSHGRHHRGTHSYRHFARPLSRSHGRELGRATDVDEPLNLHDTSRVIVEEVNGEVWAQWGAPGWRQVRVGDEVRRPLSLRTVGIDGFVRVGVKGAKLSIGNDAVVHVGAAGVGLGVQVESGLMLAYRSKQAVRALVPKHEVEVLGPSFGIWALPDRVNIAVIDGDAEIRSRDADLEKVLAGREVTIRRGRLDKSNMAETLSIELITKRRVGRRSRIAARTAANAVVFAYDGDGFEEIELTRGGTFAVQVPGELPEPGTLVALDAAGRWAELEQPSRRLEQVLADLKSGKPRATHTVPQDDGAEGVRSAQSARRRRRARRRARARAEEAASTATEGERRRSGREAPGLLEEERTGSRRRRGPARPTRKPPPLPDTDDEDADEEAL